jgi:hypothetical protein
MKRSTWRVAFIGAGITALVLATSLRLNREGRRPVHSTELLSDSSVDSLARIETKHRIARDVLAGRTSLLAAAAAFRRLDEQPPAGARGPHFWMAAASTDEAYCRSVIAWASTEAPDGQANEVMKRLKAELATMIRDGTLHLPDAKDAAPG